MPEHSHCSFRQKEINPQQYLGINYLGVTRHAYSWKSQSPPNLHLQTSENIVVFHKDQYSAIPLHDKISGWELVEDWKGRTDWNFLTAEVIPNNQTANKRFGAKLPFTAKAAMVSLANTKFNFLHCTTFFPHTFNLGIKQNKNLKAWKLRTNLPLDIKKLVE